MVRVGWARSNLMFPGVGALALLACLPLLNETLAYPEPVLPGWRDYLIYLNKGTLPPTVSEFKPVDLFTWLLPRFLLALIIAICLETIHGPYSVNTLTRARSRQTWWVSSWAWMMTATVIFYAVAFTAPGLLCLVTGSFAPAGTDIVADMCLGVHLGEMDEQRVVALLLLPLVGSLMLGTIQIGISLCVTPMVGLVTTILILAGSVLGSTTWLIGNVGMLARTHAILPNHPTVGTTMLLGTTVTVAAAGLGLIGFQRKDILTAQGNDS